MATCEYDNGSMYGNRPACSSPATTTATYSVPCYGSFTVHLCSRHIRSMAGRVYPSELVVTR